MSQGTLYANEKIRGVIPQALIKHFKLDVNVVAPDATWSKYFPTERVPAFVGPKGLKLSEAIAISIYRMFFFGVK